MEALLRGDWDDVRRLAAGTVKPLATRLCGLIEAEGRILAGDVRALVDLPTADVSAMDGWAVAGPGPWQICGRIVNGTDSVTGLSVGTAVGIGTGGVVPGGATAIVRREHGDLVADRLKWTPAAGVGLDLRDVRPRGDEARLGDVMVPAGTRLDAMHLALAASVGHDQLEVAGVPEVELLVTGDEVDMTGLPAVGRVRDSVSPALSGLARGSGAVIAAVTAVPDDVDLLVARLVGSAADVIVTTGGTAVGEADHLREALLRVRAEILVDGMAVRPGAPSILAMLPDGRLVAGLPGNPFAAVVGFLALVEPALRAMTQERDRPRTYERLGVDLGALARTRILPFNRVPHGLVPTSWTGSSMLRGLATADGLMVVRPGPADVGATVETLAPTWRQR